MTTPTPRIPLNPRDPKVCPICKGSYLRTYEEHTGSGRHRVAVEKATGRRP